MQQIILCALAPQKSPSWQKKIGKRYSAAAQRMCMRQEQIKTIMGVMSQNGTIFTQKARKSLKGASCKPRSQVIRSYCKLRRRECDGWVFFPIMVWKVGFRWWKMDTAMYVNMPAKNIDRYLKNGPSGFVFKQDNNQKKTSNLVEVFFEESSVKNCAGVLSCPIWTHRKLMGYF